MCGYVQDSVKSFLEQTGISGPLRGAQTPFLGDEETETEVPGKHSAVARSVLAKLLYCSRLARPDLMLPINLLSRNLTTWTEYHDRALARLMSYTVHSQKFVLKGHIGAQAPVMELYCDADHAGCKKTQRSTSGIWLEVRTGPSSTFPVDWSSKRQGLVSFSTPEAELVSLDLALKAHGLPCRNLMQATALNKGVRESAMPLGILIESVRVSSKTVPLNNMIHLVVQEDNTAAIVIATKGRSPSLRHLSKTHRINIAWLGEVFAEEENEIVHCETVKQKADGFTKPLERLKFYGMLEQLGIS
jgi:hypothetical protein